MSAAAHCHLAREFAWMLAGLDGKLVESTFDPWASGPLRGARHGFTYLCAERIPDSQSERLAAQLASREFLLADDFVADARMIFEDGPLCPDRRVRIEALTISA